MSATANDPDWLREVRTRTYTEGGVFWTPGGELAVFEPEAAQKINALNFADLTLPDRLTDVLRGRAGPPVSWKSLRAAWTVQLRRLSDAEGLRRLAARMEALLDERLDRPLDLVWAAQEVVTQALLPAVVDGVGAADRARLLRDQTFKLRRLVATVRSRETLWTTARSMWIQVAAGSVVRRELRGRAAGRRPRRLDLTDPVVDLLDELGIDRAVDAVTAVLTAIAGPPGATAACLLYELTRRPDWAARLADELEPVAPEVLYAGPTRAAPVTLRFVKETLRMWSPPLLMTRPVRTDIELDQIRLEPDQRYLLSTYLIHHHPRHWKDPEAFDPDRWLPASDRGPSCPATYVPFGWPPKSCIGAGLGTAQLILLCHLVSTRYRTEVAHPEAVGMALTAVARPQRFHGVITRRPA